jgi:hypothetical protein
MKSPPNKAVEPTASSLRSYLTPASGGSPRAFDRQIVAIAKVARATAIYSDDADVRSMAAAQDIAVIGLAELPLPPVDPQMAMQFEPPTPAQEDPPGEPDEDIEAPEDEPNDGAEQEPG